jgi:hypothetical protein
MGASCGISQECLRYAAGHDLPITYFIEDNGLSVTTDTQKVWGTKKEAKHRVYNINESIRTREQENTFCSKSGRIPLCFVCGANTRGSHEAII